MVATVQLGSGYTGDPTGTVYDPAKGEIFETSGAGASVFVISDSNNAVTATAPLVQLPNDNAPYPMGLAYDSAKGEIFVARGDNAVSVIPDSSSSSTSSTPTPTSSPSATSTASSSPTPKVPEFSNAALVTVAAAMVVVTLSAVAIRRKKA